VHNRQSGERVLFPAAEIVDAGFLELVRYGIRKAGDPLIEDSLRVVDAVLKKDFPAGPCWLRYTHDGYGQRDDGSGFDIWGVGRPWPLLCGERGHYELAAGRDVRSYVVALERFATATKLLPEQIWDLPDNPAALLTYGGPTGSAMPLMWAHAEYVKLVRSVGDGQVFDLIPEVVRHFQKDGRKKIEVWKANRQVKSIAAGTRLRIIAAKPFMLHWGRGDWNPVRDTYSASTAIGIDYVDIETAPGDRSPLRFTFYWTKESRWEGRDYAVALTNK
jgi:glucoamylase